MGDLENKAREFADWSHEMKRDWDERARHDAKWFIYPRGFQLSERSFDATGAREVERLVREDLELLTGGRDPRKLRLLELGCGIGRMTGHLARIFGEVYATDVSGEMIRQARERLTNFPNIHFYETSGYDFAELPDEFVDVAFSAFVFQHVPSAEIISSNLHDAYRVLRTGGAFKFQTNSLTTFDFEEMEKDTWMGASFPEPLIRAFAASTDAQLIAIDGAGSQYCWTILRKRMPGAPRHYVESPLRIAFFGRTDAPMEKRAPVAGAHASLTLVAAGLRRDAMDCNSLVVDISGLEVAPCYVGPVRGAFASLLPAEVVGLLARLTRIDFHLPAGSPTGAAEVSVRVPSGEMSAPIRVEFVSPPPVIPQITRIMNGSSETAEIRSLGPKSLVRLHVEGLDETADTGNIRVQIGERIVKPCYVGAITGHSLYRVDLQLPPGIRTGLADLRLYFGNLASPVERIEVRVGE